MNGSPFILSWSGGKDSCLACHRSIRRGYNVKYLLNLISREFGRCCFHGLQAELMRAQADLAGISMAQKAVGADMDEYEKDFKAAVSGLEDAGGMIFGDIYIDAHKEWVERVCRDLGVGCVEPLWNESPDKILEEFIAEGFRAVVVSCQAEKLDGSFVGRFVDEELVRVLKKRDVCPCGENGEYHTLVVSGPLFKGEIEILRSEPVLRKGFWDHWFLDIKEYRIVEEKNK